MCVWECILAPDCRVISLLMFFLRIFIYLYYPFSQFEILIVFFFNFYFSYFFFLSFFFVFFCFSNFTNISLSKVKVEQPQCGWRSVWNIGGLQILGKIIIFRWEDEACVCGAEIKKYISYCFQLDIIWLSPSDYVLLYVHV